MARSLVAGANALFRAAESRENPDILVDPWSSAFSESDLRIVALRYARRLIPPLGRLVGELQVAHCVRHRAIDELVLQALDAGAKQVVVVGAGYDMRLSRFASRIDGTRWIEVDHPETQAKKWALLDRAEGVNRRVVKIGVDLMETTLGAALTPALDPARPTTWVLEGLIHYLSRPRLEGMLADMARLTPNRTVVLSFIRSDMYASADPLFIEIVKLIREIPRLHFAPAELAALCAAHGLPRFRSWTAAEQIEAFCPNAKGRPIRLSQDVALADSAA